MFFAGECSFVTKTQRNQVFLTSKNDSDSASDGIGVSIRGIDSRINHPHDAMHKVSVFNEILVEKANALAAKYWEV
ncbi:MAG: hypothetical protein AAGD25_11140 [Cyanobacteria bacterium P01_F01_bin.150]